MFDGMRGYGYHPGESTLQLVREPLPVWLDLALVYPVPEDSPVTEQQGHDVQAEVRAEVDMRDVALTGHTLLHVRYDAPLVNPAMPQGIAYARQTQWVLAWCTRPRDDGQPLPGVHTRRPPKPQTQ